MLMLLNIHNVQEKSLSIKLTQASPDPVIGLDDIHTIRIPDSNCTFLSNMVLTIAKVAQSGEPCWKNGLDMERIAANRFLPSFGLQTPWHL